MSDAPDSMFPTAVIEPPSWMTEPATGAVLAALSARGAGVRFVGGCVRDTLLGRAIGDIDIATQDPPERVIELLCAAAIKAVPTGLAHGTVTAIVPPRHFEITTLRHDVETFGRHARVAFTDDWAADAARRDFTMNALFLDASGRVFDPAGGLADLRAGRVRFVGDATTRIREDILRLLRFYRFHAHYGHGAADMTARRACGALAHLLPGLSGERVASELLKLLLAPDPTATIDMMAADGVLTMLLPGGANLERLAGLVRIDGTPDALRRLAALLPSDAAAVREVALRLRLPNADRDRLVLLAAPPFPIDLAGDEAAQRRALHHLGLARYADLMLLHAAETGNAGAAQALLDAAPRRLPPVLPVRGGDVIRLGVPPGPRVGELLARVEEWWEARDFRPDRAACLAYLAEVVAAGWHGSVAPKPDDSPRQTALVVMGVSGSGKSTVAAILAARLGWQFVEGDALHPPENVEKMRRGIPLDDADRRLWLERIARLIDGWRVAGTHGVVTCSALKRVYRETLTAGHADVRFVYLKGSRSTIAGRLSRRSNHYMPPELLDSQFATLEEPGGDEPGVAVDIGASPDSIADSALSALRLSPAV
jgi:poly(A) polymerase